MSTKLTFTEVLYQLLISLILFGFTYGIGSLPLYDEPPTTTTLLIASTVFAVLTFYMLIKQLKSKKMLNAKTSHLSEFDKTKLQVLGFLAMADEEVQDSEVADIAKMYKGNNQGESVSTQDIKDIVKLVVDSHTSAETFGKDIKENLSEDEKIQLIQMGHAFITSDGKTDEKGLDKLKEIFGYAVKEYLEKNSTTS